MEILTFNLLIANKIFSKRMNHCTPCSCGVICPGLILPQKQLLIYFDNLKYLYCILRTIMFALYEHIIAKCMARSRMVLSKTLQ